MKKIAALLIISMLLLSNCNTVAAVGAEGLGLRNSKLDKAYSNSGEVDIGQKRTLCITMEKLKLEEAYTNKPVKITLQIGKSTATFESSWNDGVYVSVTDFDKTDKDVDIYITETGTDVQATTYIYKVRLDSGGVLTPSEF